ncbi:hypothetical protein GCM10027269_30270 [Kribbella endophytica]
MRTTRPYAAAPLPLGTFIPIRHHHARPQPTLRPRRLLADPNHRHPPTTTPQNYLAARQLTPYDDPTPSFADNRPTPTARTQAHAPTHT